MPPSVNEALPEASESREKASDEDGAATTKEVVVWLSQPAADKGATKVRRAVAKAGEPGGAFVFSSNSKLHGVKELGAVDDGFI